MNKKNCLVLAATFVTFYATAQNAKQDSLSREAARTELWEPVPPIVTPGATPADAPSDAIILFNGRDLSQWCNGSDTTQPAMWTVGNGFFTVKKGTGSIMTKQKFTDYQLHAEWRIPENIHGESQARGNSGIFLASLGKGDVGYEIQVLDVYNNKTYVNGQTGSIYKQVIPLANANKKPGEWQVYDIIWTAPRFNSNGILIAPAYVTAMLNGVLLLNNFEVKGQTQWIGQPFYKAHGAAPIKLQDHGDPSEPISYRNIWVRPLN
ncbi:DUF1080 domain-containing protein [soil metagenome]